MLGLKSKTLRTGREDGMRWRCPNQRRRRCRRRDDAVGCVGHSGVTTPQQHVYSFHLVGVRDAIEPSICRHLYDIV